MPAPVALVPVRPGVAFEIPLADDGAERPLARIESVLPDSLYVGFADHGMEITHERLAAWGYKLAEED